MTSCADLRILFRAPAGARHGFGHLARCRSLAGAFGVRTLISLRGGAAGEETALALGCDVVRGGPITLLESIAPDVLVVDDPDTADAARWRAAGRRAGCLVISVHDLGLGCLDADLVIDGSVTLNAHASRGLTSAGPESGLLDPSLLDEKASRKPFSVLVTIGGGPPLDLAIEIAEAIVDADPRVTVRLAGGFLSAPPPVRERISRVGPARSLGEETARASVPVFVSQRPTVAAFVARRAARGSARRAVSPADMAEECVSLLTDTAMRRRLSIAGGRVIDGHGTARMAAAVARLADGSARRCD
jgi:spore coat polysaccharide biosynthesis predicted glycosyltransferase SpsG